MAKTLGDITQELSERVLAPAKAEAESIVGEARKQAAAILAEAQAAAEKARTAAAKEAGDVRKQLQVDMDTAARNFLIMVQEKLEAAVVTPVVEGQIKAALNDPGFLKRVIEILLAEFLKHQGQEKPLELLLPEKSRTELDAWLMEKCREKAAGSLSVQFTALSLRSAGVDPGGPGGGLPQEGRSPPASAARCDTRAPRGRTAPNPAEEQLVCPADRAPPALASLA